MTISRAGVVACSVVILIATVSASAQDLSPEQQIVEAIATYYISNPPVPEMRDRGIAAPPVPLRATPNCEECRVLAWVTALEPTGFIVTSWDSRVEPLIAFSTESDFPWEDGPAITFSISWGSRVEPSKVYFWESPPPDPVVVDPLIAFSTKFEFPWDDDPGNALRDVLIRDMLDRIEAHDAGVAQGAAANLLKWRSIVQSSTQFDPFDIVGAFEEPPTYASHAMLPGPTSEYEGPEPVIPGADQWNQQAVYNEYCPCSQGCPDACTSATDRYKPGCVARAMAQVLYFHRYLDTSSMGGIVGRYKSSRQECTLRRRDLALGDPNQWTVSNTASRLCFAAAASLSAEFGHATGASFEDAADVLEDVWGFRSPTHYKDADSVDLACFDRLEADVLCRRPCLLELKGYNVASHAVVCDGYREERTEVVGALPKLTNYYHLQMGRSSGGTTAWYNLTDPGNYPGDYCVTSQAILNITPPTAAECAGD